MESAKNWICVVEVAELGPTDTTETYLQAIQSAVKRLSMGNIECDGLACHHGF